MEIKEKIKGKQKDIDTNVSELKNLNIKIDQNRKEIIPILVEDIKKYLTNRSYIFFVDSKKEIESEKVKILKSEIEIAIDKSIEKLKKELNESNSWNFNEGKEEFESYKIPNRNLATNKSLWKIIKESSKPVDEIFKKFGFEPVSYYKNFYSYEDYTSPYGLTLYDLSSIYGHPPNIPDKLQLSMNDYWNNIRDYFSKISELNKLHEELRQLKREEVWGNI